MTKKIQESKDSIGIIIALAVVGLVIFLPVWINILIAPMYLAIHGLLVFGLLKITSFKSTIKPLKFGLIISGISLAFY